MTPVPTIASIKAAFWALLKSDPGAAAVAARAGLGAGASSVLTRAQFRQLGVAALPARPIAVVEFGEAPGKPLDVRSVLPTIWLYDDRAEDWERLNAEQALIEALYTVDSIAACYTTYAGGVGREQIDPATELPALALRYQVIGRF